MARQSHQVRDAMNLYEHRSRTELEAALIRMDRDTTRLKWLQSKDASTPNDDGYEWGVFRVKRDPDTGAPLEVERCNEEYIDLDMAMTVKK